MAAPFVIVICMTLMTSVVSEVMWPVTSRAAVGRTIPWLEDRIFDDHFLWSAWARSGTHCAVRCAQDDACQTFTVTPGWARGVGCRGHLALALMASSRWRNAVSTKVYSLEVMTWLDKACTRDWECAHQPSVCFAGHCLCIPGYFYSHSTGDCLADCSQADLQPQVVSYPGWYVLQHNLNSSVMSWHACLAWCTRETACRTFDFNFNTSTCFLAHVTAQQAPGYWTPQSKDQVNHYTKTCS